MLVQLACIGTWLDTSIANLLSVSLLSRLEWWVACVADLLLWTLVSQTIVLQLDRGQAVIFRLVVLAGFASQHKIWYQMRGCISSSVKFVINNQRHQIKPSLVGNCHWPGKVKSRRPFSPPPVCAFALVLSVVGTDWGFVPSRFPLPGTALLRSLSIRAAAAHPFEKLPSVGFE